MREVIYRQHKDAPAEKGWFHQWARTRFKMEDGTGDIIHKALVETEQGRVLLLAPQALRVRVQPALGDAVPVHASTMRCPLPDGRLVPHLPKYVAVDA